MKIVLGKIELIRTIEYIGVESMTSMCLEIASNNLVS
jgi:hypothetical protein